MPRSLNHYTVNTRHNLPQLIDSLDHGIIQTALDSIKYSLGDTEPTALFPGLDADTRFLMRELPGGSLKCLVYYGDQLVLGFLAARQADEAVRSQYLALIRETGLALEKSKQRWLAEMPQAPFCAVALVPQQELCPSLSWLGDFERCAAIAWLYGAELLQRPAPQEDLQTRRAKATEALNTWIIFGTPEGGPDPAMIDLLGRDFVSGFAQNVQAKCQQGPFSGLPELEPVLARVKTLLRLAK